VFLREPDQPQRFLLQRLRHLQQMMRFHFAASPRRVIRNGHA
jgi:hypothetical protein